jgi:outer membrane receptor for ferric coprogen and ferric-rhodotorulic acid
VLEVLAAQTGGAGLPSGFTYKNLGTVKDKGIELGVDAALNRYVNVFTNYSYQWEPVVEGFALSEVNIAPRNRFNAGFDFGYRRWLGNLNVSYTGDAFWQDVLDSRYSGTTDPYTTVNGTVGVEWFGSRVTTSLKVNNLGNRVVLQHIFGDVLRRQIVGEVRVGF